MHAHTNPTTIAALVFIVVPLAGCTATAEEDLSTSQSPALIVEVVDTLAVPAGYAVGEPVWVTRDSRDQYIVVDRSDKMLKVFSPTGEAMRTVGTPGRGPGEFTSLQTGGTLGDSLYGYDFTGTILSVFAPDGVYHRTLPLSSPGNPLPVAVLALDDSLFLLVGLPTGAHDKDLLRIVRRDGGERAQLFNRRQYFRTGVSDLVQSSVPQADGRDGVIFAGLMGEDSLFALDYSGRVLGSGVIPWRGDRAVPSFQSLIERNGGSRVLPNGRLVTEGEPALVRVVALGSEHALIQVMELDFQGIGRLDRLQGGTFHLVSLNHQHGSLEIGKGLELLGGLVGRDNRGALIARYVGEHFERIELVRIRVTGERGNYDND